MSPGIGAGVRSHTQFDYPSRQLGAWLFEELCSNFTQYNGTHLDERVLY